MSKEERGMLITLLRKQEKEIQIKLEAVKTVIDLVKREEKLESLKVN